MNRLHIDIGSTYFKISANGVTDQYFRDFNIDIYDDVQNKCANLLTKYPKENIFICSSANGGLSTLIIGITSLFSISASAKFSPMVLPVTVKVSQ